MVLLVTATSAGVTMAQVDNGSGADKAKMSVSDVFLFGTQTPVQPASSTLNRNKNSVEATVHTYGLVPDHVYTMWWAVFNDPKHCTAIPCGMSDLSIPKVKGSVLWATGRVADARGQATFNAHLVASNPEGQVVLGPGLLKPKKAEVHLLIRHHNEVGANGATLQDQLTMLLAGCPCTNVQAAIHLP